MRDAFVDELTRAAAADDRIALLTGDLGYKLFDRFAAACPGRFLNMGVSEANMVSVAAGLALSGMRPVTYSIVPFATARCLEQIRNDVCNMRLPVIVTGVGGGFAYGPNGPTHHGIDDIALMRAMPGMTVLCPADPWETRHALRSALASEGPSYLRLGRNREPDLASAEDAFAAGSPRTLRRGGAIAILACGPIAGEALAAVPALLRAGHDPHVVSVHTVKPIDGAIAWIRARRPAHVFVVEEHGPQGGLAEALALPLAGAPDSPILTSIAAPDRFLHDAGSQRHMWRLAGIDAAGIAAAIVRRLERTS
jgi:transketolase